MVLIPHFYKDKTILITGGSGFLGKVLIEKLLRSCPDLGHVYLLLRCDAKNTPAARKEKLLASPAFQPLLKSRPHSAQKITVIAGDITEPSLGLTTGHRRLLTDQVHVVFHCAASIDFTESYRQSIIINVEGTRQVVTLARSMPKLNALVHVSTAFSQCQRSHVREQVYTSRLQPRRVVELARRLSETDVRQLCTDHMEGRPNVYTFTKALAETAVQQEAADLPVCIVRPSIVVCSWREPMPGWVDGINFTTGFIATFGKGVARAMLCDSDAPAEIVPVDAVANFLVAAGWQTAQRHNTAVTLGSPTVYNCVAGPHRPPTWRQVQQVGLQEMWHHPMCSPVWYPSVLLTQRRVVYAIWSVLFHLLPALFLDALVLCLGRRPPMLRLHRKLLRGTRLYSYFTMRRWQFDRNNCDLLDRSLDPDDRATFRFVTGSFSWRQYIRVYINGVQTFILKENISTSQSRIRFWLLYLVHNAIKLTMVGLLVFTLVTSFRAQYVT